LKSMGDFYEFYGGSAGYFRSNDFFVSRDKNSANNERFEMPLDNKVIVHLLREELVGDKEALFDRRIFSKNSISMSGEKDEIFYQNSPSPMERKSENSSISEIRRFKT